MPAFAGWDILVKADDRTVLSPTSINVLETFGGTFTELSYCINGTGSGCDIRDGGGVAHSGGYSNGNTDSGNVTLFTVTFNSLSSTGYTFLSLPSPSITNSTGGDVTPSAANIFGASYGNPANAPVANFTWSPLEPYAGQTITLNATSSTDPTPGAVITDYNWGTQLTHIPIAYEVLQSPGNVTITLTVMDNKGHRSAPTSYPIHVRQKPITDLKMAQIVVSQYDTILPGTKLSIIAYVKNNGTLPVSFFNVTVFAGGKNLGVAKYNATTNPIGNLTQTQQTSFPYIWDTTGYTAGTYIISATVSRIAKDNNTQDKNIAIDVRIIDPLGTSALPLSAVQFLGVVVIVVAAAGFAYYQYGQHQTRKRRTRQDAL
jgi:hypothetical protein